ncbi:glycosyltransferase WbuB [Caballeronia humi]|uniref:Glycosyl transferase n=1 Tax=Caballeronia humi TaxID=326474 RepID=A0A158H4S5_9BURK|nr:glycosyltransferase WbuB [Caballeronia humi]SAL38750.1 glycosyl transferase [Caballeronia humi]
MKILIYGLNYAPELTGTGKYTAEMAEALAALGHDVRVVCAPPYYPEWKVAEGFSGWRGRRETLRGVQLWRAPLWVPRRPSGLKRILHLASFAAASLPAMMSHLRWRPQVVMTIAPSLLNAPAALAISRITGAQSWLHIQDFEVDAAFDLGLLKNERAGRAALAVERWLMQRFDVVSSISEKMIGRAAKKGVAIAKTFHLPNWVDTTAIFPLDRRSAFRRELNIGEHTMVVLYSGNMGAKQGLEVLAETAARMADREDIVFVFCGNGATKAQLQTRCATLPNVRFLCLQPLERLNELLNLADMHVLPQRGDVADLVMPSKLTGMFASARAVIAMAQPGTELFDAVTTRGVVVQPENVDRLAEAIEMLVADPELRANFGAEGRRFAQERLAPLAVFTRLDEKLTELVETQPSTDAADARTVDAGERPFAKVSERPVILRVEKVD